MCVTVYSDLFLHNEFDAWMEANLGMQFLPGYYLDGEENLWYSRMTRKVHNNTRMAGKALRK
jgi:hypothetical protein